jgi:hypothetical protein
LIGAKDEEFSAGGVGGCGGEGGEVAVSGGDDDDGDCFRGGALDYAAAVACRKEDRGETKGFG